MERGRAGSDCAGGSFQRGYHAIFPGAGFAVSGPAVSGSRRVRDAGLRGAGHRGRFRVIAPFEIDRIRAAETDGAAALDALFATGRRGIADRAHRHPISASDGRGVRDCGAGHARAIYLEDLADPGGTEIVGDGLFLTEWNSRRNFRADSFYWSDAGWRSGLDRAPLHSNSYRHGRNIRTSRDWDALRGISAHADYVSVYGDRAFRELHGNTTRDYFHDDRVRNFACVSKSAVVRSARAAGRHRVAITRRAPRDDVIGGGGRDADRYCRAVRAGRAHHRHRKTRRGTTGIRAVAADETGGMVAARPRRRDATGTRRLANGDGDTREIEGAGAISVSRSDFVGGARRHGGLARAARRESRESGKTRRYADAGRYADGFSQGSKGRMKSPDGRVNHAYQEFGEFAVCRKQPRPYC